MRVSFFESNINSELSFRRKSSTAFSSVCSAATAKRILILTSSNLALQVLWFFYRIMLTRLAGPQALGLQSLVMQVYSIMVSVCITGLNVAVMNAAARLSAGESSNTSYGRLLRNALSIFAMLFVGMAVPIFVFRAGIAEKLIGDPKAAVSIVIVLICIFMTGIENILKSIHIGIGRVGITSASELMEQSIRFLLVFLLLKNLNLNTDSSKVTFILSGMLMSEFFSVSFLLNSFRARCGFRVNALQRNDPSTIANLSIVFIPAALTSFSSTIFASIAALILPNRLLLSGYSRESALAAIGILNTVVVPLVTLPMTFIGSVATILFPSVSAAASKNDRYRIISLKNRSYIAALCTSLIANSVILFASKVVSSSLFGIVPTALCFLLVTFKTVIIYFQVITTAVLNGMMKQKQVFVFALLGEALQLLLIYFLSAMPAFNVYGYLVSMCIGEGLRLVLSTVYLKQKLHRSIS